MMGLHKQDMTRSSDTLNRIPNRWVGSASPVFWIIRSQDLTPIDISFNSRVKNKLYSAEIKTLII